MKGKRYLHPQNNNLSIIRTNPGITSNGKPFDWYVQEKVKKGEWKLEVVRPDVLGTERPLEIYRAKRNPNNIIKPWPKHDDDASYCPAHWADIAIGRGACGYRCRSCFLILTHRAFCDPSRHVVYENLDDYPKAVRKWLLKPNRRNLGLGIDCSDSLLYEGVTGYARRLIPLFADNQINPLGCKLILLTKSANIHYLEGLTRKNVILTFSLNPEVVADLWEGKWKDGKRITPKITERLRASRTAEKMGFEVRWRVDPILPIQGWEEHYEGFFRVAAFEGNKPTRITLGTYREMTRSLSTIASKWGLPEMEWDRSGLIKDCSHYHLPSKQRTSIYRQLKMLIEKAWSATGHSPVVALCKESRAIRKSVGLLHENCNCG